MYAHTPEPTGVVITVPNSKYYKSKPLQGLEQEDQVKRTDQPTGPYKINPNPNPNPKYAHYTKYYVINAGPFFSLDPSKSICQ